MVSHASATATDLPLRQVVIIVWPGLGVGAQPDSPASERGANTISHAASYLGGLSLPVLQWLGLGNITPIRGVPPADPPAASHGRAARASHGQELATGCDELFGEAIRAVAALGRPVHCVGPTRELLGAERPKGVLLHTDGARSSMQLLSDLVMREREGLFVGAPRPGEVSTTDSPVATGRGLARLDGDITRFVDRIQGRDDLLVIVTSVGGNDTVLTMREGVTREYAPVLAYTPAVPSGIALGERASLADIGATAAEVFGARTERGRSFLGDLLA